MTIRAAGVEVLRVHDLRHSAGTLATAVGGSLREVMDRLGDSSTVAAVRYQHVIAEEPNGQDDARLLHAPGMDWRLRIPSTTGQVTAVRPT